VHRLRQGRARGPTLIRRGAAVAFSVAAAVLVADQVLNAWVLGHVTPGMHHLLGPLGIDLGRNAGVAFSLFSGDSLLAGVLTGVLTVVVAVFAARAASPTAGVVLGLVLGGALGNDLDRIARRASGGVVDFIKLPHWPAFNLADVAITVGVVGLVALVVLHRPVVVPRRAS
jgi:signal peptidase II